MPSAVSSDRQFPKAKGKRYFFFLLPFYFLFFTFYVPSAHSTGPLTPSKQTISAAPDKNSQLENSLKRGNLTEIIPQIERSWKQEYEEYLGEKFPGLSMTADEIAATLDKIGRQTGNKTALLYMLPRPEGLQIVLVTAQNKPIRKSVSAARRETLLEVVKDFSNEIKNPRKVNTTSYLKSAKQLYEWAIAPIESDLQAQGIDTLLFCVGPGLRTIPLAALHDGKQFLVEKYSMALIPAFALTDTLYADVKNTRVLAMGASTFKEQNPLPAVPLELSTIAEKLWKGQAFLNQAFTLANLQAQRQKQYFGIIHLSTHAEFQAGEPSNSYIQFWDSKLTLDKMNDLGWNNPPVDLLVLSACRTAIGDEQAELGFAGLAVQAGVKSALASLWYVSDEGTLALMTEFYQQLQTSPIKAEALRQAQISMLRGKVSLSGGQLRGSSRNVLLPPELSGLNNENLSHPYYWAAFSIIGSPW